jgi:hypothetical protein
MDRDENINAVKSKRDQYSVEIRRKKNEDKLDAKRFKRSIFSDDKESLDLENMTQLQIDDELNKQARKLYDDSKLENYDGVKDAISIIRKIISKEDIPPLKLLLDTKMVPIIAKFMDPQYGEDLQSEASWIIINIATADEPTYIDYLANECQALPRLMTLLDSPSLDLKINALWGLANMIGDSIKYRDELLNSNIIDKLCELKRGQEIQMDSYYEEQSRLLSSLLQGRPHPEFSKVAPLLGVIIDLLKVQNEHVLFNTLWAVARLSDFDEDDSIIEEVFNLEVGIILDNVFAKNLQIFFAPALRIIGNFAASDTETVTQEALKYLPIVLPFLKDKNKMLRREACWILQNMFADKAENVTNILGITFGDQGVMDLLLDMLRHDDYLIVKEIVRCISNAATSGDDEIIQFMYIKGVMEDMIHVLKSYQAEDILCEALQTLDCILGVGNQQFENGAAFNPYLLKLQEIGGIKVLEDIQHHNGKEVFAAVSTLIDKYFQAEPLN